MVTIKRCSDNVLSVDALKPFVRQSIKNIIENEGFRYYKVDVKDISTNGGNYMAVLQAVSITGKSEDGEDKTLNLFLKNIVYLNESSLVSGSDVYLREGFVYTELFKMIDKIEDHFKIPQEERLNVAKSYGETNDQVIILEDVSKLGFKTFDRLDVVPIKFAELAMEQLAKLHAMSFVIQKEYQNYFENKIKTLHTLYRINNDLQCYMRKVCDKAMETLEDDAKSRLEKFYPKIIGKYKKYFDVPANAGIGLMHGDFRPNNILVKENDGEVIKVIPVDYQITQFGYPIIDFIYFIFVSTDRKFRTEHLEDLKNLYYTTFENFLSKFDIKAKDVFSRKQFEQEYTEKLDYGLICFLAVMPFLFAKDDAIPDVSNGFQGVTLDMNDLYKVRLHEIVEDFVQWGYL